MAIWNGLTADGAVVPIQVDAQGRVEVTDGGGIPMEVYGTAKAVGVFTEQAGTIFSMGLSASVQSSGVWVVSFSTPMPDNNYLPIAICTTNQKSLLNVGNRGVNNFEVRSWDLQGNTNPVGFGVAVFDARPADVTPA